MLHQKAGGVSPPDKSGRSALRAGGLGNLCLLISRDLLRRDFDPKVLCAATQLLSLLEGFVDCLLNFR